MTCKLYSFIEALSFEFIEGLSCDDAQGVEVCWTAFIAEDGGGGRCDLNDSGDLLTEFKP